MGELADVPKVMAGVHRWSVRTKPSNEMWTSPEWAASTATSCLLPLESSINDGLAANGG